MTRLASFTQHCPYGARPGTRSYVAACDQATTFAFPRLAGRYAAFVIGSDDEDAFTSTITVVDLPRGHRLYSRDSLAGSSFPSESVTYYYVRSFALDARGRTAWGHEWFPDGVCSTGCVAPPIGSDNREVHAHDGVGDRLLDSGPDVQVRSVAIHNGAVTWTRAGATESIALR